MTSYFHIVERMTYDTLKTYVSSSSPDGSTGSKLLSTIAGLFECCRNKGFGAALVRRARNAMQWVSVTYSYYLNRTKYDFL